MEYLTCFKCGEHIEFTDRWDKEHDKGKCSNCQIEYHILTEREFEKYTNVWNKHQSCQFEIDKLRDQVRRRNLQIKRLKKEINERNKSDFYKSLKP